MKYKYLFFIFLAAGCQTQEANHFQGSLTFEGFKGKENHIAVFSDVHNSTKVQYDCMNGTVMGAQNNHHSAFDSHWSWEIIADDYKNIILDRCKSFAPDKSLWITRDYDTLMIWQSDEDFVWAVNKSDTFVFDRSDFFKLLAKLK